MRHKKCNEKTANLALYVTFKNNFLSADIGPNAQGPLWQHRLLLLLESGVQYLPVLANGQSLPRLTLAHSQRLPLTSLRALLVLSLPLSHPAYQEARQAGCANLVADSKCRSKLAPVR